MNSNKSMAATSVWRKKRLPLLPSKVEPGNPNRQRKEPEKNQTQVYPEGDEKKSTLTSENEGECASRTMNRRRISFTKMK